jgi:hypothetical protein
VDYTLHVVQKRPDRGYTGVWGRLKYEGSSDVVGCIITEFKIYDI